MRYRGKSGLSVFRVPVGTTDFSSPEIVQTDSGALPAFYSMGIAIFPLLEVKRPGRTLNHPHPPSAKVTNEWSYTSTPPDALMT